ncbi:MAG: AAA family ATPase [Candidatus Micrarchaeota archaeon]
MGNIFRQLSGEGKIFRDERFLLPEFLPEELPGREKEMREIASYLQAAAKGRTPPSMLLTGKPGTGKTTIAKLLLNQLTEVSRKPLPIYINCWETSTRHGILNRLVIELGDMIPRRGIATDEIVMRIGEIGGRKQNIPIIILDEVDRLLAPQTREDRVLYDLSRAQEALGIDASVIAITNEENLPVKLDERVRSSLTNHTINFKPYNPNELREILRERAKMAFWQNTYDNDVIGLCAGIGAKAGGDARLTIHLLWAAGKTAEREGAKKICVKHVKEVKERSVAHATTPAERKIGDLDEMDKKIIEIISKEEGVESGKLYLKLKAKEGEQRTVRNRLEKLKKARLVECTEISKGLGRSKIWKIKRMGK